MPVSRIHSHAVHISLSISFSLTFIFFGCIWGNESWSNTWESFCDVDKSLWKVCDAQQWDASDILSCRQWWQEKIRCSWFAAEAAKASNEHFLPVQHLQISRAHSGSSKMSELHCDQLHFQSTLGWFWLVYFFAQQSHSCMNISGYKYLSWIWCCCLRGNKKAVSVLTALPICHA